MRFFVVALHDFETEVQCAFASLLYIHVEQIKHVHCTENLKRDLYILYL